MTLSILIFSLIGAIPLLMLGILLNVKMKAGESLLRVRSVDAYLFTTFSLICCLGVTYVFLFKQNNIIPAIVLLIFSVFFYLSARVRQNCITQNGIILLDSFAKLIKWEEISEFAFHNKKLYLKSSKGYMSIDFLKIDINRIKEVISEKNLNQVNK